MVDVAESVLRLDLRDSCDAEPVVRVADGRSAVQERKPLVFSCSGCSFAGKLADNVARELDRQQLAEMSCLAGIGARHHSFLSRLAGRRVWIIDGCPIECAHGVFEQAGQAGHLSKHIRLHDMGFKKTLPPVDGVNVLELARSISSRLIRPRSANLRRHEQQ